MLYKGPLADQYRLTSKISDTTGVIVKILPQVGPHTTIPRDSARRLQNMSRLQEKLAGHFTNRALSGQTQLTSCSGSPQCADNKELGVSCKFPLMKGVGGRVGCKMLHVQRGCCLPNGPRTSTRHEALLSDVYCGKSASIAVVLTPYKGAG